MIDKIYFVETEVTFVDKSNFCPQKLLLSDKARQKLLLSAKVIFVDKSNFCLDKVSFINQRVNVTNGVPYIHGVEKLPGLAYLYKNDHAQYLYFTGARIAVIRACDADGDDLSLMIGGDTCWDILELGTIKRYNGCLRGLGIQANITLKRSLDREVFTINTVIVLYVCIYSACDDCLRKNTRIFKIRLWILCCRQISCNATSNDGMDCPNYY